MSPNYEIVLENNNNAVKTVKSFFDLNDFILTIRSMMHVLCIFIHKK